MDTMSLTTWNIQDVNNPSRWARYWLPRLPLETRHAILEDVITDLFDDKDWYGERVPFLEALKRNHIGMYQEALGILLHRVRFRLWLNNINMALKEDFRMMAAGIEVLEISVSSLDLKDVRKVFSGGARFPHANLVFSSTFQKIEDTLLPWVYLMLELSPRLKSLHVSWPYYLTFDKRPQIPEYYDTYLPLRKHAKNTGQPSYYKRPLNVLQHIGHAFGVETEGILRSERSRPSWSYWCVGNAGGEPRFPDRPYSEPDYEVVEYIWRAKQGQVLVWDLDEDSE
ncbi:uncharacterized protein PAC_04538 [Phialocephala subalpina]|uniref:Uncharacterized protein n=1 Tax=Phialocephala subalpina TaxID=576137 RepID=A0A1L7WPF4_9HELO|nr:uncharacterized protein PAC_04538 [Phialocephala subalpina]